MPLRPNRPPVPSPSGAGDKFAKLAKRQRRVTIQQVSHDRQHHQSVGPCPARRAVCVAGDPCVAGEAGARQMAGLDPGRAVHPGLRRGDWGSRGRLRQAGGAPRQSGRRPQGRGHARTDRPRRPTGLGLRRLPLADARSAVGQQHRKHHGRRAAPGCDLRHQPDARRAAAGLDATARSCARSARGSARTVGR